MGQNEFEDDMDYNSEDDMNDGEHGLRPQERLLRQNEVYADC